VSAADGVRVSIDVAVPPAVAFEVFTAEIDQWWGRGPRFRFLAPYGGTLRLEPGVGGRLLHEADAPARVFVVGTVAAWEPPRRLGLSWRLPNFAPGQETRVEILFEAIDEGTRVTVAHDGWDALPAAHPARHGHLGREFVVFKGRWWGDLLAAAKQHAERTHSTRTGGQP
jgi:uncharacterized protein YndB with AHSA1/START domain